jgi:antitoxin component of MazEF toxin-antitoxin module
MTKFIAVLEENPDNPEELILPFPEELMEELGWEIGDTLTWNVGENGEITVSKKTETEWVLVECVSTFRERYMVEVPKGKADWALDTVTMNEAEEFSQKHIGEQIVSHRVVTKDEALALCDVDNEYCSSWDKETKLKSFFTFWKK